MAYVKLTILRCDHPGCKKKVGTSAVNTEEKLRAMARAANWIYSGGKDLCDEHRPKKKNGEYHSPKTTPGI